jgi:hypothetical protein
MKSSRPLVGGEVKKQAQRVLRATASPFTTKGQIKELNFRAAALLYRAGSRNGGEDPLLNPDANTLAALMASAEKWKAKQIYYDSPAITDEESRFLEQLASYPKSAALLLKDPVGIDHFFKWSLRNKLSVQVFVEFPEVTRKINVCLLRNRIGAYQGKALQCVEKDGRKDVTLLMEGNPVSILDGKKQVNLSHGLTLTVDKIFEVFKQKNYQEGYLAFFEDGVRNWDAHRIGPVKPDLTIAKELNLEQADWHKQLPMKGHYSAEEASLLFGKPLDGKNYLFTLVATRQTKSLNTFGAHSFFRLLIPDGKGGYDYTFGFGKFAESYPQNMWHTFTFLGGVKKAKIQYFDNNEQYTNRQTHELHFLMNPEKGKACLESIRQDILHARKGLLAFQILVHNCTDWVCHKIKHYVDDPIAKNIFAMHLTDLEVQGPFGFIMRTAKRLPERLNRLFFRALAVLIGGKQKLHVMKKGRLKPISVARKRPYERDFQHPGMLWRKLEKVN